MSLSSSFVLQGYTKLNSRSLSKVKSFIHCAKRCLSILLKMSFKFVPNLRHLVIELIAVKNIIYVEHLFLYFPDMPLQMKPIDLCEIKTWTSALSSLGKVGQAKQVRNGRLRGQLRHLGKTVTWPPICCQQMLGFRRLNVKCP